VDTPWVDLFAVFVVCHLSGDFILQTEFQATNKHGGLGRDPVKRRALAQHTLSYTCAYLPAFLWLAGSASGAVLALTAVAIGLPHGLQDDGTAMRWWMRTVKRTQFAPGLLAMVVDQSFHMVALLLVAIAVGA
jgi:hypothetical protein